MAQTNFLFCNIGWMSRYNGLKGKRDKIVGGGKWVNENASGGEVCNFLGCANGYVYGHVEIAKGKIDRRIKIEEFGAGPKDDYVDGVTVIWTATDPDDGGRRIVGWYRNARVFRNRQNFDSPPSVQHKLDDLKSFNIRARSQNKVLVPIEERNDDHLRLRSGKGWMGHTPWWFPHLHADVPEVRTFIRLLSEIIAGNWDSNNAEVSEIKSAKNLTETQKKMLLQARVGQGKFRKSLEKEWKNACAVTGCNSGELLRASHIKPWKVSDNAERLDKNNGLLLLANLDAAFDCGLISFEDSGEMLISSELSTENQRLLGIKEGMHLRFVPQKACQTYLKYHRDEKYRL